MLKKLLVPILCCLLVGTVFCSCQTDVPQEKAIDIYIIAGQSNAAGYTKCDELTLAKLWKDYNVGTPNVLYFGSTEYTYKNADSEVAVGVNEFPVWVPVRAGMGYNMDRIGPEAGMAAYLAENYYYTSEETERVAGFIKFAHGGTSIFTAADSDHEISGSWASPSYIAYAGIEDTEFTGRLYRELLAQVESGVAALTADGYTDINLKGVFWMQGETDRDHPEEYKTAFAYFASDLRADLGELMGEDLSALPIMIGEISETSGSAIAATEAVNKAFIEAQRELASELDNVYIIPSGQYRINWMEGSFSKSHGDPWHWKTEDLFAIGQMIGECIVENILVGDPQ